MDLGPFWEAIKPEFPTRQELPPAPRGSMAEPLAPANAAEMRIEFGAPLSMPKMWFEATDGTVIQVQPDRFAFNWRQDGHPREYPFFDRVGAQFFKYLELLLDAVAPDASISDLAPDWCEIAYVNHIDPPGGHGELDRILRTVNPVAPSDIRPPAEDMQFGERFLLRREDGSARGRLTVTCVPAFRRADLLPIYDLTLAARGLTNTPDLEGIRAFMDEGHALIVTTFADITTPEMHERWERTR
jgi:uncharacterized protein (TIGR04255 family)